MPGRSGGVSGRPWAGARRAPARRRRRRAGCCRGGEEHLWTFLRGRGIEPTNNAAERALRHAVLWPKSSGGTASVWGSRFVERGLSVAATCRQQGRNGLEVLTACFEGPPYRRVAPPA